VPAVHLSLLWQSMLTLKRGRGGTLRTALLTSSLPPGCLQHRNRELFCRRLRGNCCSHRALVSVLPRGLRSNCRRRRWGYVGGSGTSREVMLGEEISGEGMLGWWYAVNMVCSPFQASVTSLRYVTQCKKCIAVGTCRYICDHV
jgi:hypothetical protein